MAILKYANQSGTVYAYESISKWDPVKKQSRSKRKCLGRVDPATGEIIPTSGKRGRASKDEDKKSLEVCNGQAEPPREMERLRADYKEIKSKNKELLEENKKLKAVLSRIKKDVADI